MSYVLHLTEFDDAHERLLCYDDEPELRPEVRVWLAANLPGAKVCYDPENEFGVSIRFASKEDCALFTTFWIGRDGVA